MATVIQSAGVPWQSVLVKWTWKSSARQPDAIQHHNNAWLREFGTGNKKLQHIIEQTEAFLNAYDLSRYAPLGYDPRDLAIRDLAGYR